MSVGVCVCVCLLDGCILRVVGCLRRAINLAKNLAMHLRWRFLSRPAKFRAARRFWWSSVAGRDALINDIFIHIPATKSSQVIRKIKLSELSGQSVKWALKQSILKVIQLEVKTIKKLRRFSILHTY